MARPRRQADLELMKQIITPDFVREQLDYNPETGELIRKLAGPHHAHLVGKPFGGLDTKGYIKGHFAGFHTYGHILAWIHYYGEWPEAELDHIDQNPTNNKIENLRIGKPEINQKNARLSSRNQTGYIGVSLCFSAPGDKCYKATTTVNGKQYHHGYFHTAEEAYFARQAWISEHPEAGFTERHGR